MICFLHVFYGMFQRCARDLLSQDRDETHVSETETFKILSETRRCSFRDAGRDLEALETLESLGSFNVSLRRFQRRIVKYIDNEKNYEKRYTD